MGETMKLLPCPFCGSTLVTSRGGDPYDMIVCDDCNCASRGISKDEVVAAWNTRVTTPMMGEEFESNLALAINDAMCAATDEGKKTTTEVTARILADPNVRAILSRLPAVGASQSTERDRVLDELRWIAEQKYSDRSTVTPENAFEAFQKLNAKVCEIYDHAEAGIRAMKGSSPPPAGAE